MYFWQATFETECYSLWSEICFKSAKIMKKSLVKTSINKKKISKKQLTICSYIYIQFHVTFDNNSILKWNLRTTGACFKKRTEIFGIVGNLLVYSLFQEKVSQTSPIKNRFPAYKRIFMIFDADKNQKITIRPVYGSTKICLRITNFL